MARPSPLTRASVAAAALAWIACGNASDGAMPVSAAPPAQPDLVFQREGVPGPWWRDGASQEMFDAEHRVCLARSRELRANAPPEKGAEAAYRGFLDCMKQYAWNRGVPPRT